MRSLRNLHIEVHHDRGELANVRARVGHVCVFDATVPYEAIADTLRLLAKAVEVYQNPDGLVLQ